MHVEIHFPLSIYTLPTTAPTNPNPTMTLIIHPNPVLEPALAYPESSPSLPFLTLAVLKHSNIKPPVAYSPRVFVKHPATYSGLSVTQNWKHPLSALAFDEDPGAEYVAMALM
jgi:hypothetical protein